MAIFKQPFFLSLPLVNVRSFVCTLLVFSVFLSWSWQCYLIKNNKNVRSSWNKIWIKSSAWFWLLSFSVLSPNPTLQSFPSGINWTSWEFPIIAPVKIIYSQNPQFLLNLQCLLLICSDFTLFEVCSDGNLSRVKTMRLVCVRVKTL